MNYKCIPTITLKRNTKKIIIKRQIKKVKIHTKFILKSQVFKTQE